MSRAHRLLPLVPAAVLAAATLLPIGWESPVPLCLVKALTGLDCPGCGMTRAFLLIGHGHFADAAAMHLASIPAYVVVAALAAMGVARIVRDLRQVIRRGTCRRSRTEPGPGALPRGS